MAIGQKEISDAIKKTLEEGRFLLQERNRQGHTGEGPKGTKKD